MLTTMRLESEAFLRTLQDSFRPRVLPNVSVAEVGVASRSHNPYFDVGGDWYDIVDRVEKSQLTAMVGDVVGHGIEQINVMGQLRAAANALARICPSPREIIETLDEIALDMPGAEHSTAIVVTLDGDGTGLVTSAGHPPMLRICPSGVVEPVMTGRRMPLALGGPTMVGRFRYEPGELLVLYTDGVIDRDDYGLYEAMRRVGEVAAASSADNCQDIANTVLTDVQSHARDDAVVMVLKPSD